MRNENHKCVVGLVQMSCSTDLAANLQKAQMRIAEAAKQGAQVICLPELFRSLYFCQEENHDWFQIAEPIPGPSTTALSRAAREHNVVIIGSLFERRAPGIYHNTAVVLDADGALAGIYRKMHIPDDPLYYEKFYFTPGDLGFKTFETKFAKIGTLVCWDQWYPEAARLTALQGAEILFYPTAIGWHASEKKEFGEEQQNAWQTIQCSHAIANGVFVAAVNRIGHEKPLQGSPGASASYEGIEFWGSSFVCDPFGRILERAEHEKEQILLAECDLALVEETRRHWPFLRDRRIDAYQGIDRRFMENQGRGDGCP